MATLVKTVHVTKSVNNVTKLLSHLSISPGSSGEPIAFQRPRIPLMHYAFMHTTPRPFGLMEFFDDRKNWGKQEVKVGRSWRLDELRIKSNEDLHKLWYVLLKEKNMLLTMEHACTEEYEIFPNPERIDKIKESMSNLEAIVRERNKAFHLLETGETGERPGKLVSSALGLRRYHRMGEYVIPQYMNKTWYKKHFFGHGSYAVQKFLRLYREKLWLAKKREKNRNKNRVMQILKQFPNVDPEAIKKNFPDSDIENLKLRKKAQGHRAPE
ncbi:39S ribosomal protein L47, mitochondrial [Orussus abietinus]|uniref:39S ribosomal protein L47, mitochondrial n=1 Tax=Orussus abietinus TaxID=222816 RepID=UPI0006266241|nr:39S ribosomal protein L47, mitochondrial [Orussus abietinus]